MLWSVLFAWWLVAAHSANVFEQYVSILGEKKMLTSFESAEIFGQSIQDTPTLVGRNHLTCFSYQGGADFGKTLFVCFLFLTFYAGEFINFFFFFLLLAKEYRASEGFVAMNASVFYVNEDDDTMCFIVDYPEESAAIQEASSAMDLSLQKIMFSNKLQDALKVDPSIYESIDASAAVLEELSDVSLRRLSDAIKLNLYAPETHTQKLSSDNALACKVHGRRTCIILFFSNFICMYSLSNYSGISHRC
jgi:hypothetical protein